MHRRGWHADGVEQLAGRGLTAGAESEIGCRDRCERMGPRGHPGGNDWQRGGLECGAVPCGSPAIDR